MQVDYRSHLKRVCETVASRLNDERGRNLGVHVADRKRSTRLIDRIAEETVIEYVENTPLPVNILSEECGYIDRGMKETLIVDPVDGTHNAIRGIPFYSISLAICRNDTQDLTHGMVMNLTTADTFWAVKGMGAFLNGLRIRTRKFTRQGSIFFGYIGRHAHEKMELIYRIPTRFRAMGCASLEMCLVACGRADAFIILTTGGGHGLHIWDIAASYLILKESGGGAVIPEKDGVHPLTLILDPDKVFSLISFGDPEILKIIEEPH